MSQNVRKTYFRNLSALVGGSLLESLLEWVVAKWDGGERDLAARKLADALELAERLGYA
jgi:hypothetical protein